MVRRAVRADAAAIAALVRAHGSTLISQPELAAPFWESMSEAAHAANLDAPRFIYWVAEDDGEMVGFLALRDGSHLFNLFVQPERLRLGIGRALWQLALRHILSLINVETITVNASLNAVPVYRAFGFRETGPVVRQHGISFVPMLYILRSNLPSSQLSKKA